MAIGTYYQDLMKKASWATKPKEDEWQDIIGTMPSITEEQAAVGTPLSTYLTEAIAGIGTAPTFAEYSQGAGAIPAMFGGPLAGQAQGVYAEAMQGAFPEQYYQEAIYKPTMAEWTQDIMPQIKESYVATGAITGTEVGDKIAREAGRLGQSLAGIKAGLAEQQKVKALTAAGQYGAAYMETLKLAYDNYIKQYPDTTAILQAALSYLNIPMMAAYQKPVEEVTGGGGGWTSSVGFNQGAGTKSQTSAPPVWDPNSLAAKLKYWDYYNIPEEKRNPSIGDAIANMMKAGTIKPYAGPTPTL